MSIFNGKSTATTALYERPFKLTLAKNIELQDIF